MMKGFEFCQTKPKSEIIDFKYLEKTYSRKIPPIYKLFWGNFNIRPDLKFASINSDSKLELGTIGISNDINGWIEGSNNIDDDYDERQFIQFATSGLHSGGICIGTLEGEEDKVFVDIECSGDRFQEIAPNVFEFIRGLSGRI